MGFESVEATGSGDVLARSSAAEADVIASCRVGPARHHESFGAKLLHGNLSALQGEPQPNRLGRLRPKARPPFTGI